MGFPRLCNLLHIPMGPLYSKSLAFVIYLNPASFFLQDVVFWFDFRLSFFVVIM